MAISKRPRLKSLAHGRPRTVKPGASLSSKATRTLIRKHHTLEKQRKQALAKGNDAAAAELARQIEAQGGIETYQRASLLGQGNERGGDSSKVLIEWLKPVQDAIKAMPDIHRLRLLEIGALSTTNACSRSGLFDIDRLDLNSQEEGILQQDFMERPLPKIDSERYDVISLSLVLNYVPDPAGRGEMLRRTLKFLRHTTNSTEQQQQPLNTILPSLFLVLPASCVTNSRYLDETKLKAIMNSLGYEKVQEKLSNKLAYCLWKASNLRRETRSQSFKKVELRSGAQRNNFAIVMK